MTVKNTWADPEGVPIDSHPIRYQIRDHQSGKIAERVTEMTYDFYTHSTHHALAEADQHIANEVAHLIETACRYFHAPDEEYVPLGGVPSIVISDAEVLARIERLDKGENTRELIGTNVRRRNSGYTEAEMLKAYPLVDLPWDQQRALVEQIEEFKAEWAFEWIGEAEDMPAGPRNGPARSYPTWGALAPDLDDYGDEWNAFYFPM